MLPSCIALLHSQRLPHQRLPHPFCGPQQPGKGGHLLLQRSCERLSMWHILLPTRLLCTRHLGPRLPSIGLLQNRQLGTQVLGTR